MYSFMVNFMNNLVNRVKFHSTHGQQPRFHAPSYRRVINRQPSHVAAASRITLPDGSWLPASEHELARYFREESDLATPSLNALDTRSPSYQDILSYLIDTGRTPATSLDIQEAFLAIHRRLPGSIEKDTMVSYVQEFGLYQD